MAAASSVRKAIPADAPRLALALASAFQDDPVIAWVFPDEQHRRAVLPAFMEFRLRKLAFPHDQIWMTTDGAAAAVWFPPCTVATASRSRPRSSFRVVQGSGPCGAILPPTDRSGA
jgi:hypothetical protein